MITNRRILHLATLSSLVTLVSSCRAPADRDAFASSASPSATPSRIVYVESNDPRAGKNAILAFARAEDGSLTPLPGSPFPTQGTGVGNPKHELGPSDSDQEIAASSDRRFLFAVNSGSDTVAVFRIAADGALSAIPGSPFDSEGENPVSVGVAGSYLVMVNKAQDPARPAPTCPPNYTVFSIMPDGALRHVPGSTVETTPGASPTQALISPDGDLVFGTDLLAPLAPEPKGALRSFRLEQGLLIPGPGTPLALPPDPAGPPLALGLAAHPALPLLFVGLPARNQVGVYGYDREAELQPLAVAANSGKAPCWLAIDHAGTRLYTTNTPDGTISTYDITDPRTPREIQKITLRDTGPIFGEGERAAVSSGPTQLSLDPEGRVLYVVSQRLTVDPQFPGGNAVHALTLRADGTLAEILPEVPLPVPPEARAQGIVVF
jgi:6-phosphogluconolactonase (cycloisomerase 2 family)